MAVVGGAGRNSPEIFYFARALTLDRRTGSGTFNLDKIVPFIRREAYRKSHVGSALRSGIEVILTLARL